MKIKKRFSPNPKLTANSYLDMGLFSFEKIFKRSFHSGFCWFLFNQTMMNLLKDCISQNKVDLRERKKNEKAKIKKEFY